MLGGSLSVGCSFVYARRLLVPKEIPPLALTTYQIGLALLLSGCSLISMEPGAFMKMKLRFEQSRRGRRAFDSVRRVCIADRQAFAPTQWDVSNLN
jgi:hypothetical protein